MPVNVGNTANDGGGDPIRNAFITLNQEVAAHAAAILGLNPLLTPSYANRASAVTGAQTLVSQVSMIFVREGNALVLRSRTASAVDPLYAEGAPARWGVTLSIDPTELRAGRIWGISTTNISTLTPAEGAEQISVAHNGGHTLWRRLTPAPTTPNPLIHAQTADGRWWLLCEDTAAIKAALATLTTELRPSLITVTEQSGGAPRDSRNWNVPTTFRTVTAAVITQAPPGVASPATARTETVPISGGVKLIWRDQSGQVFERLWDGAAWGSWNRTPVLGDIAAVDTRLTGESAARQQQHSDLQSAPTFTFGRPLIMARNGPLLGVRSTGLDMMFSDELLARYQIGGGGGGGGGVASPDGTWAGKQEGSIVTFTAPAGKGMVDRFYMRGGERRPTANLGDGRKRRARVICHYGASNAGIAGGTETPRTFWTKNDVPHHTLTLNDFGSNRGGLRGFGGGDRTNTATSLVEAAEVSQLQSVVTATSQALAVLDGVEMGVNIVRSEAKGGEPLVGTATALWKETLTSPVTQTFTNLHTSIRQMYDLAVAEGYEVPAIYIPFTAGAGGNEGTIGAAEYLSRWMGFKADLESRLVDLGVPIVWLMDQNGPAAVGSNLAQQIESRIAQVQASFAENGGANVILAQPGYHLAFVWDYDAGVILDATHTSNQDRLLRGEGYAHAIKEYEGGRRWRCPRPVSAAVNGTSVVVDFQSIYPIRVDWDFCKSQPDGGFTFSGASVATTIRQTGARQITVTCNTSPAGQRMWYAGRPIADESWPCEFSKSRGAIRENWSAPSAIFAGRQILRPAVAWFFDLGV